MSTETEIEVPAGFELYPLDRWNTTIVRQTQAGLEILISRADDGTYTVEFGQSKLHRSMAKIVAALPAWVGSKISCGTDFQAAVKLVEQAVAAANA